MYHRIMLRKPDSYGIRRHANVFFRVNYSSVLSSGRHLNDVINQAKNYSTNYTSGV